MEPGLRASIAYVAGRLVAGRDAAGVYDYGRSRFVSLRGLLDEREINVYDQERGCFLHGNVHGSRYSLFHHGEGHHVDLELDRDVFRGYDHRSACFFEGRVHARSIVLFDTEENGYFEYSI